MTASVIRGDARVEVNEARILATRAGSDWWLSFRRHMEPAGRITVLTASIGGDRIAVACDSTTDAVWLRDHMIASGIPAGAVRVAKPKGGKK